MWNYSIFFCLRASSQDLVTLNFVLCNLCYHTRLLVVSPVAPSSITGKYSGWCGRLNYNPVRIGHRNGNMNSPSKTLFPPPRSLCTDPAFVFNLKLYSLVKCYVGSPPTLVRKVIRNDDVMSFAFTMVMVIDDQFLWWSLGFCIDAVRKWRQIFGLKQFLGKQIWGVVVVTTGWVTWTH